MFQRGEFGRPRLWNAVLKRWQGRDTGQGPDPPESGLKIGEVSDETKERSDGLQAYTGHGRD